MMQQSRAPCQPVEKVSFNFLLKCRFFLDIYNILLLLTVECCQAFCIMWLRVWLTERFCALFILCSRRANSSSGSACFTVYLHCQVCVEWCNAVFRDVQVESCAC